MKKLVVRSFVGCLLSSRALHLGSAQDGKLEVKDTPSALILQPRGTVFFAWPDSRVRTHSRNCSTLRQLLCELQYLHAGTLFARPRPPCTRGCRWSTVNTSRFLSSVSASSRRYSRAPQYQQKPPVLAQTYCRLILPAFISKFFHRTGAGRVQIRTRLNAARIGKPIGRERAHRRSPHHTPNSGAQRFRNAS
jgi:hypothetical protein